MNRLAAMTGAELLHIGGVPVSAPVTAAAAILAVEAPSCVLMTSPPSTATSPTPGSAPAKAGKSATASASAAPSSGGGGGMCDEKTVEYLRDLIAEKQTIENNNNNSGEQESSSAKSIVLRLLDQEIARIQSGGKPPGRDSKFVDIYHEKPIRLTVRALVPVKEHPKFNFVGKLLGPKGNSMKRLQEDTLTKMAVLGRGSMRNKQQEEDLRKSSDPKYQHLNDELHVEITAFAPPSEAHARIAYALTEVRKYLIPDSNDEIRQEQMREMELLNTTKTSPPQGVQAMVTNTDGHDEMASDETGSNSPPGSSPSPPSSTVIAMRGINGNNSGSQVVASNGGRQRYHLSNQGNVQQHVRNGSNSNKYLRGHLYTSGSGGGQNAIQVQQSQQTSSSSSSARPSSSKVRVLSILDKIRSNTTQEYVTTRPAMSSGAQTIQTSAHHEPLIDAINLVEDNGFTLEDYEPNAVASMKGFKSTTLDRGRYRMHIAPYSRPK